MPKFMYKIKPDKATFLI